MILFTAVINAYCYYNYCYCKYFDVNFYNVNIVNNSRIFKYTLCNCKIYNFRINNFSIHSLRINNFIHNNFGIHNKIYNCKKNFNFKFYLTKIYKYDIVANAMTSFFETSKLWSSINLALVGMEFRKPR
jgi:hypothetical protein